MTTAKPRYNFIIGPGVSWKVNPTIGIDGNKYFWRCYSKVNFLRIGARYFGYRPDWYDGPIHCFGFWLFEVITMVAPDVGPDGP